jgi:hypothetical protein
VVYFGFMNRKKKLILLVSLLLTFPLFSQNIPHKLRDSGFNEYILIHYYDDTVYGYYTFDDWTTEDTSDTITFIVRDGEVIDYYKTKKAKD